MGKACNILLFTTRANQFSGKRCYCNDVLRRKNILTLWYFMLVASCEKLFYIRVRYFFLSFSGSLFSAVSSVEMLCTVVGTAMLNSLYPKSLKFNAPGFVLFLAGIFLLLPFAFTL